MSVKLQPIPPNCPPARVRVIVAENELIHARNRFHRVRNLQTVSYAVFESARLACLRAEEELRAAKAGI